MKRAFIILGLSILAVVVSIVALFAVAFSGTAPIVDGKELSGGVRIVKDGIVSVGLLPAGPGAFVLVDCGNDPNATAIKAELQRQHAGPQSVKAILLTHGHRDHVNGCKAFPGTPILGMPAESALLAGLGGQRSPLSKVLGHKDTGVRITQSLKDGATFLLGPLSITAYAVPGHTDGSAAYFTGGVVYLGDSADSGKKGNLVPAKWLFSNDRAQNLASLKNLYRQLEPKAASVKWLVFSHSGPLETLEPLAKFAAGT